MITGSLQSSHIIFFLSLHLAIHTVSHNKQLKFLMTKVTPIMSPITAEMSLACQTTFHGNQDSAHSLVAVLIGEGWSHF